MSLPFLPGNTFRDQNKTNYHVSQQLTYKNGYALSKGSVQPLDMEVNYEPSYTYGQAKQAPPEQFVPGHVAWDKKVLKFNAWFKQTVHESNAEFYRVRLVNIYYYLEDDSISVMEPHVENSGIPQGKLIKRQRLPKNDCGEHWHWKDLNIGMNIVFYGKIFHVFDCDLWTHDFMSSEGIDLNPKEDAPKDNYNTRRVKLSELRTYKTPSDFDKLRQFLEMDGKVLRFYCIWDQRDEMFGQLNKFVIHYYLVDDSLEIREVHTANNGKEPFPVLINRHKVPKDRYQIASTFPHIVLELSKTEISEYLTPRDFKIGETVIIYNRKFLIYDIDDFTKAFYWKHFGVTDFTPHIVDEQHEKLAKMELAPYNGYGSLEDSLQSCLTLVPNPPKKDYIKMLDNDHKILRFQAMIDTSNPEDQSRRFILSFYLSDDTFTIYEPPVRNSGIIGGKFLEHTRLAKPSSSPNRPEFYGASDCHIGAIIEVFSLRFVITDCDEFVTSYMSSHSSQFPAETLNSLAAHKKPAEDFSVPQDSETIECLAREIESQLKKLSVTANNRKDKVFLSINVGRRGYITLTDLANLVKRYHLPADAPVILALAKRIGSDPEKITLEEMRRFFEIDRPMAQSYNPLLGNPMPPSLL